MDISTRKEFSSRTQNTLRTHDSSVPTGIRGRESRRTGKGEQTRDSGEGRERRRHDSGNRCPVYKDKVLHDRNVVRSSMILEYVDREVEGSFIFLSRF